MSETSGERESVCVCVGWKGFVEKGYGWVRFVRAEVFGCWERGDGVRGWGRRERVLLDRQMDRQDMTSESRNVGFPCALGPIHGLFLFIPFIPFILFVPIHSSHSFIHSFVHPIHNGIRRVYGAQVPSLLFGGTRAGKGVQRAEGGCF